MKEAPVKTIIITGTMLSQSLLEKIVMDVRRNKAKKESA